MFQHALKVGLMAAALGAMVQHANAFAHRGCWGGWGGCCGYGYAGCGYGGCGPYGYGGYGGYYGGYYAGGGYPGMMYGGYPQRSPAAAATASAVPATNAGTNSAAETGYLHVKVPADAKVVINGHPTTSTGESRRYKSVGLQPSATYRYQVQADFIVNGKPVSQQKTVDLPAGKEVTVSFDAPTGSAAPGLAANTSRDSR